MGMAEKIVQNFSRMRMSGEMCDFIIVSDDGRIFNVHKAFLAASNGFFSSRTKAGETSIKMQNVNGDVLAVILDSLYSTGNEVPLTLDNITAVTKAASFFDVDTLFEACERFLKTCPIPATDLLDILATARLCSLADAEKRCMEYMQTYLTNTMKHCDVFSSASSDDFFDIKSLQKISFKDMEECLLGYKVEKIKPVDKLRTISLWSVEGRTDKEITRLLRLVNITCLNEGDFGMMKENNDFSHILRVEECFKILGLVEEYIEGHIRRDIIMNVSLPEECTKHIAFLRTPTTSSTSKGSSVSYLDVEDRCVYNIWLRKRFGDSCRVTSFRNLMFIVDSPGARVCLFEPTRGRMMDLGPAPKKGSKAFFLLSCQDRIIRMGGYDEVNSDASLIIRHCRDVFIYSFAEFKFRKLCKMPKDFACTSAIEWQGSVYAVGYVLKGETSFKMFRLDIENACWKLAGTVDGETDYRLKFVKDADDMLYVTSSNNGEYRRCRYSSEKEAFDEMEKFGSGDKFNTLLGSDRSHNFFWNIYSTKEFSESSKGGTNRHTIDLFQMDSDDLLSNPCLLTFYNYT